MYSNAKSLKASRVDGFMKKKKIDTCHRSLFTMDFSISPYSIPRASQVRVWPPRIGKCQTTEADGAQEVHLAGGQSRAHSSTFASRRPRIKDTKKKMTYDAELRIFFIKKSYWGWPSQSSVVSHLTSQPTLSLYLLISLYQVITRRRRKF